MLVFHGEWPIVNQTGFLLNAQMSTIYALIGIL